MNRGYRRRLKNNNNIYFNIFIIMKTFLILSLIIIAIGYLIYPPLYLLNKKYKWLRDIKQLLQNLFVRNVIPFIVCFATLLVLYNNIKNNMSLSYSPDSIACLSTLLIATITFLGKLITHNDKDKNGTEEAYQEISYWVILIGTLALVISITYYIFQWAVVIN